VVDHGITSLETVGVVDNHSSRRTFVDSVYMFLIIPLSRFVEGANPVVTVKGSLSDHLRLLKLFLNAFKRWR
jgi:hypothetical protein